MLFARRRRVACVTVAASSEKCRVVYCTAPHGKAVGEAIDEALAAS